MSPWFFTFRKFNSIIGDNNVTYEEIYQLLDYNQNGKVDCNDFEKFNSINFADLNALLKKFDFKYLCKDLAYSATQLEMDSIPSFLWSSREFVLAAVSESPFALKFINDDLKGDIDIAFAAIGRFGSAKEYLSPQLRANKQFMLAAIQTYYVPLKYASDELKSDRDIVLAAVKFDKTAMESANPKFRSDKQIILAAVQNNGLALKYANDDLNNDKDIVLAAVRSCGSALVYASDNLKNNRDVILAAIEINRNTIYNANVKPTAINIEALYYANDNLMATLSEDYIDIFECLNDDKKQKIWLRILERYPFGKYFGLGALRNWESFKSAVKRDYNIEFFSRFHSFDILFEVIKNRNCPIDANTRYAILIFPKVDHNNAFSRFPIVDRLLKLGYVVKYYEAATEDQMKEYLESVTQGGTYKTNLLILAGHGSSQSLALGGKDLGATREKITEENEYLYIDTSDFKKEPPDISFDRYVKENADLVYFGCLNGEGRENNPESLANVTATTVHQITIHAADGPMNISEIDVKDGRFQIKWLDANVYIPKIQK